MNDKWSLFQKFLITENVQIRVEDFLINAVLLTLLTSLLAFSYWKCGKSLSNKKSFASNFMLIAFTTMLIISIVKSSLALSLGLVGALSIVRFRSAIKEPEELSYLFLSIALGTGLGADQRSIVVVAFFFIMAFIWGRHFMKPMKAVNNLYVTISANNPQQVQLEQMNAVMDSCFKGAELKRYDENETLFEASYLVDPGKNGSLQKCRNELKAIAPQMHLTFVDNKVH